MICECGDEMQFVGTDWICERCARKKDEEESFYSNKDYVKFRNGLPFEKQQKFIELIGEAIQYGIKRLNDDLNKRYNKIQEVKKDG